VRLELWEWREADWKEMNLERAESSDWTDLERTVSRGEVRWVSAYCFSAKWKDSVRSFVDSMMCEVSFDTLRFCVLLEVKEIMS
jgi:hypothetical protein